jgi:hypothetical protein
MPRGSATGPPATRERPTLTSTLRRSARVDGPTAPGRQPCTARSGSTGASARATIPGRSGPRRGRRAPRRFRGAPMRRSPGSDRGRGAGSKRRRNRRRAAPNPPLLLVALRFLITAVPAVFVSRPGVGWRTVVAISEPVDLVQPSGGRRDPAPAAGMERGAHRVSGAPRCRAAATDGARRSLTWQQLPHWGCFASGQPGDGAEPAT